MGLSIITVMALSLWIILWSIGAKGIDAMMLAIVIILTAVMFRVVAPFLPGNRRD